MSKVTTKVAVISPALFYACCFPPFSLLDRDVIVDDQWRPKFGSAFSQSQNGVEFSRHARLLTPRVNQACNPSVLEDDVGRIGDGVGGEGDA